MTGKEFINIVSNSQHDFIQIVLDILSEAGIRYCMIGGFAVNAFVEPVISLDLDIVVASDQIDVINTPAIENNFTIIHYKHIINLTSKASDLRVQLQTDSRYQSFISRAELRNVMGYIMPVARLADVLQGKIWAVMDTERRKSKRQKDLADILRIIESYPEMTDMLPQKLQDIIADK